MKKKSMLPALFIMMFSAALFCQTALKLPEILTRAEKRITVNCLLGKTGSQLPLPWVVFSDRDKGDFRFGEKFYAVEERETELHIYRAVACRDRKLISTTDLGWRNKSEFLVSFGADFTGNSLIHRKCVILNHHKTIERIKRGEISESEVPLYKSSSDPAPVDRVPLYLIYFVYKSENGRYLLGKDYKFDPEQPFADQIIGWVDKDRVFDYNNRICFEPNFEESAVAFRRTHPVYAAKVFEFESDLSRFLKGDSAIKPLWTEPNYYYFRNPKYAPDNPGTKEPIDLYERNYSVSLLNKLYEYKGNVNEIRQNNLLTGKPLPGNKFRFPLIRMDNLPENTFITGVIGRFENERKTKERLCEALKANKSQVVVYFILDNSIDRNRLTYVIGQIEQEFTSFQKRYGVCFFPRPQIGQYKVSIDDNGTTGNRTNYQYVRDYIRNYTPGNKYEIGHDNVLNTLKFVLDNEKFDSRFTNIVVLVNNHKIDVPDPGLAGLRQDIQDKIAQKNCYLLAFDYNGDHNFVQQVQEISVAAGKLFGDKLKLATQDIRFGKTTLGYELENAGILSIIEQTDTSRLAAVQMQSFLQTGYSKIIQTLNNAIEHLCMGDPLTVNAGNHEDPFEKALKEIPGEEGNVQYIRALEEGYSSLKFELPYTGYQEDIWKANVMMTKPELEALTSLLDKALVQSNNSHFSKSVYDLWMALYNRFVGDNLPSSELLPMTPQVIMGRILGESFGYGLADPVKRYPLERILANDQDIQKYFDDYRGKLTRCKNSMKEILASGRLKFSLAEDAASSNQASARKGIYYYWVPMDILP
jgi:hypothetical protein